MIHNMKKSRILILSIIGIIVISLGILTWNHQSKKSGEDLTKYDYVVSFYSIHQNGKMNPQTKIIFVSSDQEQLEFSDKVNKAGKLFRKEILFVHILSVEINLYFLNPHQDIQHSLRPRACLIQIYIL